MKNLHLQTKKNGRIKTKTVFGILERFEIRNVSVSFILFFVFYWHEILDG